MPFRFQFEEMVITEINLVYAFIILRNTSGNKPFQPGGIDNEVKTGESGRRLFVHDFQEQDYDL